MMTARPDVDAELKRRGVAAVTAMLGDGVGANRGATVNLWVRGLADPDRAYVEDWLGRQEAEAATLAADRHKEMMVPAASAARWAFWAFVLGALTLAVSLVALFK